MKIKLIKKVNQNNFDDVFITKGKKGKKEWEIIFSPVIETVDLFSFSKSFWYIGDFFLSQIIKVGGAIETCSPLLKKDWEGMKPSDIGKLFHPADLPKMEAFLVFTAEYLSKKTEKERANIKVSSLFRMRDKGNKYTWRLMEYPKIHYENNMPRYVFCKISDYNHLVSKPTCTMFVLDSNAKTETLYYCESSNVILVPVEGGKALSNREIQVIGLLCKGLLSKEIAEILKISKHTVENHKQNIFLKTKTKKVTELVTFANTYLETTSS